MAHKDGLFSLCAQLRFSYNRNRRALPRRGVTAAHGDCEGTVTWEYNLQCSTDDGAPNVCSCMASNNNIEYWDKHPDPPDMACAPEQ